MIKYTWLLIALLICGCSPKVIYRGDPGAGGFMSWDVKHSGEYAEQKVKPIKADTEDRQAVAYTPAKQFRYFPVADTSKKAFKYNILNGRYPLIDTIPPDSFMNGADSLLLAAQKDFIRAEEIRSHKWIKLLIFSLIVLAGLTWFFINIFPDLAYYHWLNLFLLLMALIGILIFLGSILFLIIMQDLLHKRNGVSKIMSAPNQAPALRRIEYEVRCIKMIRSYMSSLLLNKKVDFIRDLGKSDPDNPWLKELDKLGLSDILEKNLIDRRQHFTTAVVLIVLVYLLLFFI